MPKTIERIKHKLYRIHNQLLSDSSGTYLCSVCNRKVCYFTPLSDFYRENQAKHGYIYTLDDAETLNYKAYTCPHCWASDRDRLFALFIAKRVLKTQPLKLLEIAPSQPLSAMLRAYGKVSLRTADLMMDGVDDHIDITDMHSYSDGCFDAVICSHVLEHVADDRKALNELRRILKPGGWES